MSTGNTTLSQTGDANAAGAVACRSPKSAYKKLFLGFQSGLIKNSPVPGGGIEVPKKDIPR